MIPTGTVYLVGAGPGDPELLTVKAQRLLREASLVLHDDLVPSAILFLAGEQAEVVNVGSAHSTPLADVLDAVAQLSGASVPVLRRVAQPGDVDATAADLTKARALLGYEPQVGLAEGLRRQWEWLAASEHGSHPVTMEAAR